MNNVNNPFLLYGYVSPDYFCDREEETKEIISALKNGRNITLMSPRRMGKTGLIHHVFHQIKSTEKDAACFYLDIFSTRSLQDFVELFGRCVIGKLDTPAQRAAGFVSQLFKNTKLIFSTDLLTNQPQVTLDFRPEDTKSTLEEIFAYLKQSDRKCFIAIDEFQQILEYGDNGVEALLRSHTQFCPNVHFIFSGSKQHLMADIFSSAKRPFYQSTEKMALAPINEDNYYSFAQKHLAAKSIHLPRETFSHIYQMFEGHTWYIQYVLNCLYANEKPNVSIDDATDAIMHIVKQEESAFASELDKLTENQYRLLVAIGREGVVGSINGSAFIKAHKLKGSSSINKALQYLLNKELVYKSINGYIIYNRFLGIWLKTR
ncbi:MAG: ATP-binding protein [Bacteroidales bacterium]|nr:ATP-binding protein [Candidatus Colimorpha merdihippi]